MKTERSQLTSAGLQVLYEPDEAHAAKADIVLVHGIGGHPVRTWQYRHAPRAPQRSCSLRRSGSLRRLFSHSSVSSSSSSSGKLKKLNKSAPPPPPAARLTKSTSKLGLISKDPPDAEKGPDDVDVFWPLDFLPESCANARILTWGHHTFQLGNKLLVAQPDIFAQADGLLRDLSDFRTDTGTLQRPLVFIAHSTGGIIVKDLLRRLESERRLCARDILLSTAAVVFLGCPHRGSNKTSLASAVQSMAGVTLGVDANDPVLAQLSGSEHSHLEHSREAFIRLWNDFNFKTKTFRERRHIGSTVQDIRAGHLRREASFFDDIREGMENIDADHRAMCQFKSAEDTGYKSLVAFLCSIIDNEATKHILLTPREKGCLRFLAAPNARGYDEPPINNFPGTCTWLYRKRQFRDWYHRRYGKENKVLWLTGDSGSGKSTQLQHLYNKIEKHWTGESTEIIWCRAAGQDLDRVFFTSPPQCVSEFGPVAVFRSMLCQLFPHDQGLRFKLLSLFKANRSQPQPLNDLELLRFFVDEYMENPIETPLRRVFILVDASETCGLTYIQELLYCLGRVARNSDFSICLATRHTDYIPEYTIHVNLNDHVLEDIEMFVHSHLKANWDERSVVVRKVAAKSKGVMFWAELVTNLLNQVIEEGMAQDFVDQVLEELPTDLDGLYRWVLGTLSAEEKADALVLMQWVMLAPEGRPMRLNDLRIAVRLTRIWPMDTVKPYMSLNIGPPASMSDLQKSGKHFDNPHQFRLWLCSRTLGLLEVKSDAKGGGRDGSLGLQLVQPIHESVRTFFMSGQGFAVLSDMNDREASVPPISELVELNHYPLVHTILTYLNTLDLSPIGNADLQSTNASTATEESPTWRKTVIDQRNLIMSSYPFLQYAVECLLYHLLSPSYFRYFLPQQALVKTLSANHCRIWRRWTALLGQSEPAAVFSRCASAQHLLGSEYGATYRLERVFRTVSRMAAGRGALPAKLLCSTTTRGKVSEVEVKKPRVPSFTLQSPSSVKSRRSARSRGTIIVSRRSG